MSQLQILTNNFGNIRLNVLSFNSPIFGSINGAQTKKIMQWYPIKSNQPEIEFEVQFVSEKDYERFQKIVKDSQDSSLNARPAQKTMVYLNWPERNINNWSGMITEFTAGGMRANPAPTAKFTVFLVDSFIAQYTELATIAPTFAQGLNIVMNGFSNLININALGIQLPSFPPWMRQQQRNRNSQQQTEQNPPYIINPNTE